MTTTFKHIQVPEAKRMLTDKSVYLLDIRDNQAFATAHIPQAKHLKREDLEAFVSSADKQKPVICYCYHGYSSQTVASYLVQQGFREVFSMDGGYAQWEAEYGT